MFLLNSLNSVKKNLEQYQGLNLPFLLLETRMQPQHQQDTCGRQGFKMTLPHSPIHASVIYQISRIW